MAEGKLHLTALGNFDGVIQCLLDGLFIRGTLPHRIEHLLAALDIEFFCFKLHAVVLFEGMVCLNTQQDFLGHAVLFCKVVAVVGCDKADIQFPGQTNQVAKDALLLTDAVILQLDKVVVPAKYAQIKLCRFLGLLVIVLAQRSGHLSRQAGRQGNQSL